jgi:hypothetical protein
MLSFCCRKPVVQKFPSFIVKHLAYSNEIVTSKNHVIKKDNMGTEVRLFLGFLQNSELRMHLRGSALWDEARTLGFTPLKEVEQETKKYIGIYVSSSLSLRELGEQEQMIKKQLQIYCPKLSLETHRSLIFTQLFIL